MENTLMIVETLPGLRSFPVWLAVTYGGVVIAMVVDFATGVRKARRAGIATRSRGYKKTCDKAVKYLLPMICLTCIDIISSVFFSAPFLTMAMGVFNIFCEWKSVMETTYEKKQIRDAADTVRAIIENRDDLARAIVDILERELIEKAESDAQD
ncbi:MAG: phage holin family protein [Muribaculaceae bacterium]|nr:phage holin family protein [Muribaculaceae bacterium]